MWRRCWEAFCHATRTLKAWLTMCSGLAFAAGVMAAGTGSVMVFVVMAGSLQQVWVDPISKRGASVASPPEISAAGRHLNFTKAADELFVTQAAVSHQIKHLEEQLGTLLFRRLNRQLLLTDAGQTLLQPMTEALDLMAAGIDRLDRRQREGVLAVSTI